MARRIEKAFGKPVGWLDIPHETDPMTVVMKIGERLDEAMKAAGHASQAALSRASGVPQPTINRILNGTVGKYGPEVETVKRLAIACGVTFAWLNEGTAVENTNVPLLTARQREWLSLLNDLGSRDIEEFSELIKARQIRNRQLVAELTATMAVPKPGCPSS